MSSEVALTIIITAVIMFFILKYSFRRKVAEGIPYINYVDEKLLDLVRTRQISVATQYYQQYTGVSADEAEKIIYYLVQRPESLLLMVRLQGDGQPPLYTDDALLDYLKQGRASKAILHYSKMTGADVHEAQIAVNAIAVNPEMKFLPRGDASA